MEPECWQAAIDALKNQARLETLRWVPELSMASADKLGDREPTISPDKRVRRFIE
jgi:hypothetical protein